MHKISLQLLVLVLFSFLDELANSMSALTFYFFIKLSPMCLSGLSSTFLAAFPSSFFNAHLAFLFFSQCILPPKKSEHAHLTPKGRFSKKIVCLFLFMFFSNLNKPANLLTPSMPSLFQACFSSCF